MVASILRVTALSVASACCAPLFGAIVYNESVNGDLSNIGSTPTGISVSIGSNQILGSTGRGTDNVIDRDYFTFVVPTGACSRTCLNSPALFPPVLLPSLVYRLETP